MNLTVGDVVVYGGHGAGRVVAREARPKGATGREVVVIELAEALTVTLPIERALEYLRPVASEHEMAGVRKTLRAEVPVSDDVWLKRCKATRAKVIVGAPIGLAEVVRDSVNRDRRSVARGSTGRLSLSERQLYLKARRLLADEIGLARGVEAAAAETWIDDQLSFAEQ